MKLLVLITGFRFKAQHKQVKLGFDKSVVHDVFPIAIVSAFITFSITIIRSLILVAN
jgi:hypothetical protein